MIRETPVEDRILTKAQCAALAEQVFGFQRHSGFAAGANTRTNVRIISHWSGELRWGRNRVTLASDRRETRIRVSRFLASALGVAWTNQLDPAALEATVRAAERAARYTETVPDGPDPHLPYTGDHPKAAIWSGTTYGLTAEERARVARELIEPAEAQQMLSAGYLAAEAQAYADIDTYRGTSYAAMTQGRCAMTVRDPQGTGSGWAGKTSYDWAKINGPALAKRALEKCVASRNPVALEPGRYTVILEPQAVADLLRGINQGALNRPSNEGGGNSIVPPFWLRPGFSKLGLKVADERVTIGQDPLHPDLGAMPFLGLAGGLRDPYRAVNWIEKGVLTALAYSRGYAVGKLCENVMLGYRGALHMLGGETSIEEMVATTKRGLLVTRFSGVDVVDDSSLLSTGFTRDGLWLIEHGKIIKPVKNFRFFESPLFVLNQLEQLGPAEVVFSPGPEEDGSLLRPAVVPPIKARDFNFTALVDAV